MMAKWDISSLAIRCKIQVISMVSRIRFRLKKKIKRGPETPIYSSETPKPGSSQLTEKQLRLRKFYTGN